MYGADLCVSPGNDKYGLRYHINAAEGPTERGIGATGESPFPSPFFKGGFGGIFALVAAGVPAGRILLRGPGPLPKKSYMAGGNPGADVRRGPDKYGRRYHINAAEGPAERGMGATGESPHFRHSCGSRNPGLSRVRGSP